MNHQEQFAALTLAEQFVDDVTLMHMMLLRLPQADPVDYGCDAASIRERYAGVTVAVWDYAPEAYFDHWRQFADGSTAMRARDTMRWEVRR